MGGGVIAWLNNEAHHLLWETLSDLRGNNRGRKVKTRGGGGGGGYRVKCKLVLEKRRKCLCAARQGTACITVQEHLADSPLRR